MEDRGSIPMNASDYYESDSALGEYLLFHYGSAAEVLPWAGGPRDALHFPVRCVSECLDPARLPSAARALDLGCAVGRTAFELARHCAEVVAIDHSHRFIDAANHLRERGSLPYVHVEEGRLMTQATAAVPDDIDRQKVRFEVGDAQSLRSDLGTFDVVVMANLVDRLREPKRCLERLPELVRMGGQLILCTPGTWLESYTPASNWLGGFIREGQAVRTLDSLRAQLGSRFELTRILDLPFLIREHARKFQWSVSQASCWRRRGI
jgi:putative 4-mercaptohistidine N1-methyltranferase